MRVYYDRLVDDADRAWLVTFLKETMQSEFNTNFDELFKKLDFNKDGTQMCALASSIKSALWTSMPNLSHTHAHLFRCC